MRKITDCLYAPEMDGTNGEKENHERSGNPAEQHHEWSGAGVQGARGPGSRGEKGKRVLSAGGWTEVAQAGGHWVFWPRWQVCC